MRRALISVLLASLVSLQIGNATKPYDDFKKFLNGLQMDAVLPMMSMSDVFIGGLVVAKG